jgi:hypothetical protein
MTMYAEHFIRHYKHLIFIEVIDVRIQINETGRQYDPNRPEDRYGCTVL